MLETKKKMQVFIRVPSLQKPLMADKNVTSSLHQNSCQGSDFTMFLLAISDTISHNILFQIFYIYSYLIRYHVLIASALGFDIYICFIVIITKMD